MKKVIVAGALSAVAMYLFDPRLGRSRRARLRDQLGGLLRRGGRNASRKADYARGQVEGLRYSATAESPPASDETLTDKVESEVLSRWNYPKGQINVNTVDGVVELRGVCDSEDQLSQVEQEVRKVSGVVDVHNYLHLRNTPAPNKQDAINAGR